MVWYRRRLYRNPQAYGVVMEWWLGWVDFVQWFIPRPVTGKKTRRLYRQLLIEASWRLNFVMLTVSSCIIATFGLISNSTAVIIGAMLVAPLMLPLRGLAFAALEGELKLFWRSLYSITGATALSLALSWMIGVVIGIPDFGSELTARTQPNLIDLGIAVAAGGISGFAKVRRGISDALAGTAIAVALMPPLCVVGLSFSQGYFNYSRGAFLLYLTNLLGITLACMVVYILAGYAEINHALGWTMALTLILLVPLGQDLFNLCNSSAYNKPSPASSQLKPSPSVKMLKMFGCGLTGLLPRRLSMSISRRKKKLPPDKLSSLKNFYANVTVKFFKSFFKLVRSKKSKPMISIPMTWTSPN